MVQIWSQANSYAKFILMLGFVYPICMVILAYKIEKMYKQYEQKEKAPSAATE